MLKLILCLILSLSSVSAISFPFGEKPEFLGLKVDEVENILTDTLELWEEGPRGWFSLPEAYGFLDNQKGRIAILSEDGRLLREIPYPGILEDQESMLVLATGSPGRLFVWDDLGSRFLKYHDSEWMVVQVKDLGPTLPEQLIQVSGGLMIVDSMQGRILHFEETSKAVLKTTTLAASLPALPTCFSRQYCAAIADSADLGSFEVTRFNGKGFESAFKVGPVTDLAGIKILSATPDSVALAIYRGSEARTSLHEIRLYDWSGKLLRVRNPKGQLPDWEMRPPALSKNRALLLPIRSNNGDQAELELWSFPLNL